MLKFRGASNLSLDSKGRMVLPARYRERLAEISDSQLIVTIDIEKHCLAIYPLTEWEVLEEKINSLPALNKAAQHLQRRLIGHAAEVEVNDSGRILLPSVLRSYAKLDKKVVLAGLGNKFELWDQQLWEQANQEEMEGELPVGFAGLF